MNRLRVELGERGYDILIGHGLLARAHEHLVPFAPRRRLLVISDEQVWAAQGERLCRGLHPILAEPILVPPGERSKSWPQLISLVDELLTRGIERGDHLVAFGGGVVGDLAGFAAAVVKRGCGFVQIPTSLLAQVDSSVGGKTGINTGQGKNLVGAFHQPSRVLIDPELLDTLDRRELRAGFAEIVKYALIDDAPFFGWLERHSREILDLQPQFLDRAIRIAVDGKRRIVEADEHETKGRRALLNLGHTFGHALEAESEFDLLHGEAVAIGLVLAFRYSVARGLCDAADADRVEAALAAAGLPTSFNANPTRLVSHMRNDKKSCDGVVPFILARGIGKAFVDRSVKLSEIEGFLERQGPCVHG